MIKNKNKNYQVRNAAWARNLPDPLLLRVERATVAPRLVGFVNLQRHHPATLQLVNTCTHSFTAHTHMRTSINNNKLNCGDVVAQGKRFWGSGPGSNPASPTMIWFALQDHRGNNVENLMVERETYPCGKKDLWHFFKYQISKII